ncbi:hypothetical protein Athai_58090 [Actinocatenispora thailandica]|uniref:Uncharacterized protein n=1 Tax=Actinocatenispora thailandica TaxID=227318 RepID=A0A7R7DVB1_9ACTN|nr:hypothetical protein [Actinocatenispora thailandica]BCJ38306.1 hypothetical protein Athai_58090 [Actinocatenispora thailandica]
MQIPVGRLLRAAGVLPAGLVPGADGPPRAPGGTRAAPEETHQTAEDRSGQVTEQDT